MALPFTMTIAGTIPLLFCILLRLIQKEKFEIAFGIRLLKFSLFFYLVPIQLLYHILPYSVYYFFKSEEAANNSINGVLRISFENRWILSFGDTYIWIPIWLFPLFILWFICVLIFAATEIKKYRKHVKSIFSNWKSNIQTDKSCILTHEESGSPYSIGFRKSYIVMPKKMFDSEYGEILYKHELCHIQNHDIWMKLLCLGAICLHFYNPFSYVLLFMYNTLCEYRCDAFAVSSLTDSERKNYARLLVEISADSLPLPVIWRNGFASSKFNIKRRILYIMNKKTRKIFPKITASILSAFAIVACVSTIWAYEPLQTTNWSPQEFVGDSENEYIEFFSPESLEKSPYYCEEEVVDFSSADIVLKSENGEYIPLPAENANAKAACKHTYKTQYIYEHIPQSNGGCSVKKYAASVCSKCNAVRSRTLEMTFTYPNCPHN